MPKTKGKKKESGSEVSSKVEQVSGNKMISGSSPSELVVAEEAAVTLVSEKFEEVGKIVETEGGLDEPKEVDETEDDIDGLYEFEKVGMRNNSSDAPDKSNEEGEKEGTTYAFDTPEKGCRKEETNNGLDGSEKVAESEKETEYLGKFGKVDDSKDSLDKSGNGDIKGETMGAFGNSKEGYKEGENKDGKAESMRTTAIEGKKVEERDMAEEVKEDGAQNAPIKKVKRIRKRKKAASSVAASTIPEGEKVVEGDATKEVKENDKELNAPNKRAKRTRKRRKKVAVNVAASIDAGKSNDTNKQGTPAAGKKDIKLSDGMGLVFMCNSKTKKDCFHYKVFGLPPSKKEVVARVYKGMKLFLFDVDLKLMYGIYKAAASGGYNIEPKAFKSAFPSQVRFEVLSDCLPVPEEKFKEAIKENYYGRNKFDCQLSSEQVKNLCKLFQSVGETSKKKKKQSKEVIREETKPAPTTQGRKRSRLEKAKQDHSNSRGRDLHGRREAQSLPSRKRSRPERVRQEVNIPTVREAWDSYPRREAYRSPPRSLVLPPAPLPLVLSSQPPHAVNYAYAQSGDDYYYRREPRLEYLDPYSMYREPVSREPVPYHSASYPASITYPASTLYNTSSSTIAAAPLMRYNASSSTIAAPPQMMYNASSSTTSAPPSLYSASTLTPAQYNPSSLTAAAPPSLYNASSLTPADPPPPYNTSSSNPSAPPALYFRY